MKGKKLIAIAAATMALGTSVAVAAGCGAVESKGLYASYYYHNHKELDTPVSYSYKLEVFSDGTYELNYETMWALPVVTLVYGRELTSYGKYTDVTPSDAEEGIAVYKLELPTRMTMIHESRSSVTLAVDTARWPQGDPANDVAPGITYTLNERAETETWETAESFIAAYGRAYTVTCDTTNGSMKVQVEGEQIPADGAVKAE